MPRFQTILAVLNVPIVYYQTSNRAREMRLRFFRFFDSLSCCPFPSPSLSLFHPFSIRMANNFLLGFRLLFVPSFLISIACFDIWIKHQVGTRCAIIFVCDFSCEAVSEYCVLIAVRGFYLCHFGGSYICVRSSASPLQVHFYFISFSTGFAIAAAIQRTSVLCISICILYRAVCILYMMRSLHNTRFISQFKINYFAFVAAHRLAQLNVWYSRPCAMHLRFKCIWALWCLCHFVLGFIISLSWLFMITGSHAILSLSQFIQQTLTSRFWWHKQMTSPIELKIDV